MRKQTVKLVASLQVDKQHPCTDTMVLDWVEQSVVTIYTICYNRVETGFPIPNCVPVGLEG